VPGTEAEFNQSLERANRVVDYLELAELTCLDALHRTESCGGHFREESQTPDGEAARKDDEFGYAAAWEFTGTGTAAATAVTRPATARWNPVVHHAGRSRSRPPTSKTNPPTRNANGKGMSAGWIGWPSMLALLRMCLTLDDGDDRRATVAAARLHHRPGADRQSNQPG
jgi:hypothetical protein